MESKKTITNERLKVKIKNLTFKNPLIAASGTVGYGREYEKFFPLSSLGGIALKGTTKEKRKGNASPRIVETESGILNSVGLENPGIDELLNIHLPYLLDKNTRIIANIGGSSFKEYEHIAEKLDSSSVDAIELNISCPNLKNGGMSFGTCPENVEKIVSMVRKKTKKFLIVKLSPNVSSISEIAKAAESSGADAISLINTLLGMKINIKTRRPILKNNTGGLSGPILLPVAVRMVWQARKAVLIPIIGCGGISSFEDALEIIMAGASLFQIGSILFKDPTAPITILNDLNNWLVENKIKNISEISGSVQDW